MIKDDLADFIVVAEGSVSSWMLRTRRPDGPRRVLDLHGTLRQCFSAKESAPRRKMEDGTSSQFALAGAGTMAVSIPS